MSKLESELSFTDKIINLVYENLTNGCAAEVRLQRDEKIDSITDGLLLGLDKKGCTVKPVMDMNSNRVPSYYLAITKR
jgi:hypothetical protein